jgi:GMP synthase (glutamine-hydrolysing)
MELPGTKQRHEHFTDRPIYDYGIRTWLAQFLDHWLALGQTRQLQAAE